jgi:uncharacterized cupredoxin-like copper-binding protein
VTLLPLAALAAAAGLTGASLGLAVPAGAATRPTMVKATETDFHIALSKKGFAPGKYAFVAVNKGQTTHALEITGSGVHATTKDFSPGQRATLTVTLRKGTYDIFCPVPGHKALGMNVTITVGGAATSAAVGATVSDARGGSSGAGGGGGYRY